MPKAPRVIAGAGANGAGSLPHALNRAATFPKAGSKTEGATPSSSTRGEPLLPYDNQPGQRTFCPRSVPTQHSRSPRLSPRETLELVHLRRARMAGVRRHWRLAKQLSPSLTNNDLAGWFAAYPGSAMKAGNIVPNCPVKRISWLVSLRRAFTRSRNSLARLRIDAAIWQEIIRIRGKRRFTASTKRQSNV